MAVKLLKTILIFAAITVAVLIVAFILAFMQGDCSYGPIPERERCVSTKHSFFLGGLAVSFLLSAIASYGVWKGRR